MCPQLQLQLQSRRYGLHKLLYSRKQPRRPTWCRRTWRLPTWCRPMRHHRAPLLLHLRVAILGAYQIQTLWQNRAYCRHLILLLLLICMYDRRSFLNDTPLAAAVLSVVSLIALALIFLIAFLLVRRRKAVLTARKAVPYVLGPRRGVRARSSSTQILPNRSFMRTARNSNSRESGGVVHITKPALPPTARIHASQQGAGPSGWRLPSPRPSPPLSLPIYSSMVDIDP